MVNQRASFGLNNYSFPVSCGFAKRKDKANLTRVLNAYDLADLVVQHGLSSLEIQFPLLLPDLEPGTIDAFRKYLHARQIQLVLATGVVDADNLRKQLPLAARAGAKVVRAVVSSVLEGARYSIGDTAVAAASWGGVLAREKVAENWQAHLDEIRRRLITVLPLLREYKLVLALENHQDCTSDELLTFCAIDPEHIGITLDVVNPMAVCEEPYAFARKVGPHIRNVHIKDYTVRATPQGYRLIRAAIGQGVIDWARMLALLREIAPNAMLQIELAAIYARHIRVFEEQWWSTFPARPVQDVVAALRFMHQHALPDNVPWRTPWELDGEDAHTETNAYELAQFAYSVQHLKTISGK